MSCPMANAPTRGLTHKAGLGTFIKGGENTNELLHELLEGDSRMTLNTGAFTDRHDEPSAWSLHDHDAALYSEVFGQFVDQVPDVIGIAVGLEDLNDSAL
jgi:hypothetical protein